MIIIGGDAVDKKNKIVYIKPDDCGFVHTCSATIWFFLPLTVEQSEVQNKNVPTMTSQMVQWTQDLTLPLYFHKQISIEFSVRNRFLGRVLFGNAVIVNFKNRVYEGKVQDGERNKIGRFQLEFEVISDNKPVQNAEASQTLIIKSILADTRKNNGKKAYLEFYIGREFLYTPELPINNDEFLSVQALKIPLQNPEPSEKLHIKLYVNQQPVAKCFMYLADIGEKKDKFYKLPMYKMNRQEVFGLLMLKMYQKKNIKTQISTPKNSTNKLPKLTTNSTLFKSNSSKLLKPKNRESSKNLRESMVKKLTKKYLQGSNLKLFSIGENDQKEIRVRKHSTPLPPVMLMSEHP